MLTRRYTRPSINLLDEILGDILFADASTTKTPIYDVIENDKEFQVNLLLAGLKKEDVIIDIEKDVLTIKAERKEVNDLKYNHKETYFGKYERKFILPDNINTENISATLVDGILNLVVPKHQDEVKLMKKIIEII